MVMWLRSFVSHTVRAFSLMLVRFILQRPCDPSLTKYIEQLTQLIFKSSQGSSIDAFVKEISAGELSQSQNMQIFLAACRRFKVNTLPDAAIDAFEVASGGKIHYSQEGEDLILSRMLGDREHGFFIDVGAHHATRFSNTYALYKKGWRGINLDATPGSMDSFCEIRPEDINIECAVSERNDEMIFSLFHEGALNTFDLSLADFYKQSGWELKAELPIAPRTLADILAENVPIGQKIDLLSVDVEGEDLAVLHSNNWEKYCPEIIIIEALNTPLAAIFDHPTVTYLSQYGFTPVSRLSNSIILRRLVNVCVAS